MAYDAVAFYITAHQDDWELFRGQQAFADVSDARDKIVFIYTTAGDAGHTDGWWEAREQGALAAARAAVPNHPITMGVVNIKGHPIVRYACANTITYCMRLPDGNGDGNGFASTGHTSLSKLRDSNTQIFAVDNSTSYSSWHDFCVTIESIIGHEREGIAQSKPWINAPDYCSATNPGDHADHKATADTVRSFASSGFNRAWWLTYCIEFCPSNLEGADLNNKSTTFFAYAKEVQRVTTIGGTPEAPSQAEWNAWGDKSYWRRIPFGQVDPDNPAPCLNCPQDQATRSVSGRPSRAMNAHGGSAISRTTKP